MFARLFKRAEASVDNALGDLGNRVLIAIPFIAAFGFAAASLSLAANRVYGPEIGNLLVAAGFVLLGFFIAIVVKVRNRSSRSVPEDMEVPRGDDERVGSDGSMFDDDKVMSIVSAAAPIVLPAMMRTATKNWPLILAAAAGLYVFSRSNGVSGSAQPPPQV